MPTSRYCDQAPWAISASLRRMAGGEPGFNFEKILADQAHQARRAAPQRRSCRRRALFDDALQHRSRESDARRLDRLKNRSAASSQGFCGSRVPPRYWPKSPRRGQSPRPRGGIRHRRRFVRFAKGAHQSESARSTSITPADRALRRSPVLPGRAARFARPGRRERDRSARCRSRRCEVGAFLLPSRLLPSLSPAGSSGALSRAAPRLFCALYDDPVFRQGSRLTLNDIL